MKRNVDAECHDLEQKDECLVADEPPSFIACHSIGIPSSFVRVPALHAAYAAVSDSSHRVQTWVAWRWRSMSEMREQEDCQLEETYGGA